MRSMRNELAQLTLRRCPCCRQPRLAGRVHMPLQEQTGSAGTKQVFELQVTMLQAFQRKSVGAEWLS